jgi:hypothetical protein
MLRVPSADGTLVTTPHVPSDDLISSLLAASDVLGTSWFAADAANVKPGKTVAFEHRYNLPQLLVGLTLDAATFYEILCGAKVTSAINRMGRLASLLLQSADSQGQPLSVENLREALLTRHKNTETDPVSAGQLVYLLNLFRRPELHTLFLHRYQHFARQLSPRLHHPD